jgi:hypothetical protein
MIQTNASPFPWNDLFNMPGDGLPKTFGITLGIENTRNLKESLIKGGVNSMMYAIARYHKIPFYFMLFSVFTQPLLKA